MKINTRLMAAVFAVLVTVIVSALESIFGVQPSLGLVFICAFSAVVYVTTNLINSGRIVVEFNEKETSNG